MALNLGPDTTRIVGYEDYKEDIEFDGSFIYIPDNKIGKRVKIKIDTVFFAILKNVCF